MYLKRIYDDGKVSCVKVIHAGPRQKFWNSLIVRGLTEGWLTVTADKFVIHGEAEDVEYLIERRPDKDDPNFHCVKL